jgi:hypothetical protein
MVAIDVGRQLGGVHVGQQWRDTGTEVVGSGAGSQGSGGTATTTTSTASLTALKKSVDFFLRRELRWVQRCQGTISIMSFFLLLQ